MELINKLLSHWFTARDGISLSLTKAIITVAAAAMTYKFHQQSEVIDFIGYAGGMSALAAALAAKYYVETPEDKAAQTMPDITGGAP